ncbi:hypothetical protein [Vibrio sp. Hep-1b-8]|uniref:hypothetical protein n=1 Tax=Vibrio sp. Hep-1b-8 TaxID=2144187 RepID=UPI001110663C|nr:hypothetical protein [Vibrio sp. Hep-1b-8]TMX47411.1 hypothetical protein DA100_00400 [Vibrio sp. Hep-1b-8]
MKKLINATVSLLILIFVSGCSGGKYFYLTDADVIENPYIVFNPPKQDWYLYKDRDWNILHEGKSTEDTAIQWIWLSNVNPSILDVTFSTDNYISPEDDYYFNSDFDEDYGRYFTEPDFLKTNKIQGITFEEMWTTYIKGIHCSAGSYLQGIGGSYAPTGSKTTSIKCGYYDKTISDNDGMRRISIRYTINFYASTSDEQKIENERYLKDAVNQIVESIKIKNLDVERMEAEGLMFYDKEFELDPEDSVIWRAE